MSTLITFVNALGQLLILLVIVWSLLSFFVSPYHPVRVALGRIIEPLLAPIRRVLPAIGIIDFSPLVLIILIQLAMYLITSLLSTLR